MLLYLYFEEERGDAGRVHQIWEWEANTNNCLRFYHIHRRSGAKIVAASGHLDQKLYKNVFEPGLHPGPRWGAYSAPPDPLAGGEGVAVPPHQLGGLESLQRSPDPL